MHLQYVDGFLRSSIVRAVGVHDVFDGVKEKTRQTAGPRASGGREVRRRIPTLDLAVTTDLSCSWDDARCTRTDGPCC